MGTFNRITMMLTVVIYAGFAVTGAVMFAGLVAMVLI
jgi:hypothetical protein